MSKGEQYRIYNSVPKRKEVMGNSAEVTKADRTVGRAVVELGTHDPGDVGHGDILWVAKRLAVIRNVECHNIRRTGIGISDGQSLIVTWPRSRRSTVFARLFASSSWRCNIDRLGGSVWIVRAVVEMIGVPATESPSANTCAEIP